VPHLYRNLSIASLALLLVACSGINAKNEEVLSAEDELKRGLGGGKLFGNIDILGGKREAESTKQGIAVNTFAWQATLDVLSFLPLVSADPFGGIIITDWYSEEGHQDERFKVNAFVLGGELKSESIKLSLFKQKKGPSGDWLVVAPEKNSARRLENAILARARQLRIERGQ